jgi:hypothetical protein
MMRNQAISITIKISINARLITRDALVGALLTPR